MPDPEFRRDLYQGIARDYDRFRLAYPGALTDDLARRCGAAGSGRLLDLGCGTGQLTFALHLRFAEVWAVDQEPDMIGVVRQKAEAAGLGTIRCLVSAAEDLAPPGDWFDLVAAGSAFHRMPRHTLASRMFRWLRPGGFLALVWADGPVPGDAPWQQALSAAMRRWQARAGTEDRVPAEYEPDRTAQPDQVILQESGFEFAGRQQVRVSKEWTPDSLAGYLFATSVLSRAALGDLAGEFAADIRRVLHECDPAGRYHQSVSFAYDLFRRPQ
jgi:ubiquinone/menaquinone biosynthesis C-methylase UbiE